MTNIIDHLQGLHEFRPMPRKDKFIAAKKLEQILKKDYHSFTWKKRYSERNWLNTSKVHRYARYIFNEWELEQYKTAYWNLYQAHTPLVDKVNYLTEWLSSPTDTLRNDEGNWFSYTRHLSHTGIPIPVALERAAPKLPSGTLLQTGGTV